ncbi:MAG: hypothetical protein WCG99_02820 [Candidatus Berkelbacteria bacterium]
MDERHPEISNEEVISLHNNSFKFENGPNGEELIALDPFSGSEISPVEPPETLVSDERLGQGYFFLAEHGSEINVDVLLAPHATAADVEAPILDYDRRIAAADLVLLEGLGWNEKLKDELNDLTLTGSMANEQYDEYCSNERRKRVIRALAKSGTAVSFLDIDSGDDSLRTSLVALQDIYEKMDQAQSPSKENVIGKIIHTIAYESLREWFMIGQIGYQLKSMTEAAGFDATKLSDLNIVASLGSAHLGVVDKLRIFMVNANMIQSDEDLGAFSQRIAESIRMGRTSMGEIEALAGELKTDE